MLYYYTCMPMAYNNIHYYMPVAYNNIQCLWQNYMWHWQVCLLTFTIELFFRYDFSLGSNFHKVHYELNIHGTDFSNPACIFLALHISGGVAQ